MCQSLVNLARLEVESGDLETRGPCGRGDRDPARVSPDGTCMPMPSAGRADPSPAGSPDEGVPYAERALSLNRQIASRRGEAISCSCLLSAVARRAGSGSSRACGACLEVNKAMGNEEGAQRAQWMLDQLAVMTQMPRRGRSAPQRRP